MAAGRHARRPPRQLRAARAAAAGAAVLILVPLAAGAAELEAHGITAFIFRQPGTGSTPGISGPAPAPAATVVLWVPALRQHRMVTVVVPVSDGEIMIVRSGVKTPAP